MHWALAIKFVRATAAPKRKTRRTADAEDTLAAVLGAWTSRALNSGSDGASSPVSVKTEQDNAACIAKNQQCIELVNHEAAGVREHPPER
jgi:hypothetical protein